MEKKQLGKVFALSLLLSSTMIASENDDVINPVSAVATKEIAPVAQTSLEDVVTKAVEEASQAPVVEQATQEVVAAAAPVVAVSRFSRVKDATKNAAINAKNALVNAVPAKETVVSGVKANAAGFVLGSYAAYDAWKKSMAVNAEDSKTIKTGKYAIKTTLAAFVGYAQFVVAKYIENNAKVVLTPGQQKLATAKVVATIALNIAYYMPQVRTLAAKLVQKGFVKSQELELTNWFNTTKDAVVAGAIIAGGVVKHVATHPKETGLALYDGSKSFVMNHNIMSESAVLMALFNGFSKLPLFAQNALLKPASMISSVASYLASTRMIDNSFVGFLVTNAAAVWAKGSDKFAPMFEAAFAKLPAKVQAAINASAPVKKFMMVAFGVWAAHKAYSIMNARLAKRSVAPVLPASPTKNADAQQPQLKVDAAQDQQPVQQPVAPVAQPAQEVGKEQGPAVAPKPATSQVSAIASRLTRGLVGQSAEQQAEAQRLAQRAACIQLVKTMDKTSADLVALVQSVAQNIDTYIKRDRDTFNLNFVKVNDAAVQSVVEVVCNHLKQKVAAGQDDVLVRQLAQYIVVAVLAQSASCTTYTGSFTEQAKQLESALK